jgi:ABC-type glycerol-3-phosphate transport system permease component
MVTQAFAGVSVVCIFAGLHAWNEFFGPLLFLQEESKYTLAMV